MPVERRGPAVVQELQHTGGKGEMRKAPISLQDLRRRIYVKAKAEPTWRFWDRTSTSAKRKRFAKPTSWPRVTMAHLGSMSHIRCHRRKRRGEFSDADLGRTGPQHVSIHAGAEEGDTEGRGQQGRVLSIPAIRDRVVQGALKLILEPIFEADFESGSYGYRPRRSAHEAVDRVAQAIVQGLTRIIDLDLRAYFTS